MQRQNEFFEFLVLTARSSGLSRTSQQIINQFQREVLSMDYRTHLPLFLDFGVGGTMSVRCINVSAPAGYGKSHFILSRVEKDSQTACLCATTGIAAINLHRPGFQTNTLASTLGFFNTESLSNPKTRSFVKWNLTLVAEHFRNLAIDEASMLGGGALQIIYEITNELNEKRGTPSNRVPRNELGLILIGDFCQLPPVNEPFAFEAPCWSQFEKKKVALRTNYRQDDPVFCDALKHLRIGDGLGALPFLKEGVTFTTTVDHSFAGTSMFATNTECEAHNLVLFDGLAGGTVEYPIRTNGHPEPHSDIPDVLSLKVGAYVMILSNEPRKKDSTDGTLGYANGDCGVVTWLGSDYARVRLKRTEDEVCIGYVKRNTETMRLAKGETFLYEDEMRGTFVTGETFYMPLRLAYGITIHKSQGLTLDSVQVDIRHAWAGQPAMLYVAASRVRRGVDLTIVGDEQQLIERCNANSKVARWF
jgi:ATP-dependent DNA helicase PIF1